VLRLLILIVIVALILLYLWRKSASKNLKNKENIYKGALFLLIVIALIFFVATTGKFIFPKILQIIKLILPIITKFIA